MVEIAMWELIYQKIGDEIITHLYAHPAEEQMVYHNYVEGLIRKWATFRNYHNPGYIARACVEKVAAQAFGDFMGEVNQGQPWDVEFGEGAYHAHADPAMRRRAAERGIWFRQNFDQHDTAREAYERSFNSELSTPFEWRGGDSFFVPRGAQNRYPRRWRQVG